MSGIDRPNNHPGMNRRHFLGTAAAATAAATLLPWSTRAGNLIADIEGVKVGIITYSYRQLPSSAEELLAYMTEAGMTTVELMGTPAEMFAGAPPPPPRPNNWRDMTAEDREAMREHGKAMSAWRPTANMDKFKELGALYRNAGVDVDILKLGDPRWSDEEIDYAFNAARAIGARGISFEISNQAARRMGSFATKHEMFIAMHNHTQVADEDFSFDIPLSVSPYSMLNLDIGHYVAGLSKSPVPIIQQYHDRITHLHLKDRKSAENGGANVVWGEGDTPIGDVLRLLQKEQYPITAMIELEYPIPEGSDVLKEVARCVEFCRKELS